MQIDYVLSCAHKSEKADEEFFFGLKYKETLINTENLPLNYTMVNQ